MEKLEGNEISNQNDSNIVLSYYVIDKTFVNIVSFLPESAFDISLDIDSADQIAMTLKQKIMFQLFKRN